ncbi:MAG: hypothetical protein IPL57_23765 [Rubrivivax sp.]|nr:hypothetical protein [Rubrivivax sp.]
MKRPVGHSHSNSLESQLMSEAIDAMRSEGAEIVDAAEFPSVVELNLAANILRFGIRVGPKAC